VGFPSSGPFRVQLDSETLLVTGVSGSTWFVQRGADGTLAVGHAAGARVFPSGNLAQTRQLSTAEYSLSGKTLTVLHPNGLISGANVTVTYTGAVLHGRGDPVYVPGTGGSWVQARYAGGEPVL